MEMKENEPLLDVPFVPLFHVISDPLRLAEEFAKFVFGERKRKKGGAPAWNHSAAVAKTVLFWGGDKKLAVVGWLHDVIKDTETPQALVARLFGQEVLDLVLEISHDKTVVDKKERNRRYAEQLKNAGPEAQIVKLADMTHNIGSANGFSNPKLWSSKKRKLAALKYNMFAHALIRAGLKKPATGRNALVLATAWREFEETLSGLLRSANFPEYPEGIICVPLISPNIPKG